MNRPLNVGVVALVMEQGPPQKQKPSSTSLLFLVFLLFLIRKCPPHFSKLLPDTAERKVRVVLLNLLTMFLAVGPKNRYR